ncbi:ABC-type (unclassified) transport system, ATPase component [Rubidibacter lacunae KORDI 51-2]|uniref:ABC-type (Unclassified) transport system, ATPase component n=1 Tax=Rubidibacter lacunae KORDI 51-2 TaxID=582515 RepID=U5DDB7_9CHRO|nr:LPS export ABC transporter ATP-binding protein [Rubidibacter lacunae]ERN42508.1 ABC-type (unclassified) transport system, ATPase component [Rubidibacter lacunae KORDI 51-2]
MGLTLKNVLKAYNKRVVVNRASLTVAPGEIVGLLGPNGAGKTTTFYLATGIVKPDEGSVWLHDTNITDLPLHCRARLGLGYLPQQPSIFRHLSVRDNLRLVIEHGGLNDRTAAIRLQQLLDDFRLQVVADTLADRVSGGERRRTELARALAVGLEGPKFLLLDEPFAGIDPIAMNEIQSIVRELRDRQLGILITDHNVRETLGIVDRAYILRDGELFASGAPQELYDNPLVRQYYLGEKFQL